MTEIGIIAITAKHVIVPTTEDPYNISFSSDIPECSYVSDMEESCKDSSSNRYPISALQSKTIGLFTERYIHPDRDIAIYHPIAIHSFIVNKLSNGKCFTFQRDFAVTESDVRVYKNGVVSGLTWGKTYGISPPYFNVKSIELGSFCLRGDSGSLVVQDLENSSTGIVVGIIIDADNAGNARCLSIEALFQLDYFNEDDTN